MLPPVRGLRFLGQRTGTSAHGGMQRSARRDGEYRRERSERGTEPPLHRPGAVPPCCRGAVRQHGRGTASTQPASADGATIRDAMTGAGHRRRIGRPPERDGEDPSRLSVRRRVVAGWRWSALVGRGGVVSGPGREWGPAVNTTPGRFAADPGREPRQIRRLASSAGADRARACGARHGGLRSAGQVPGGRHNAAA